MNQAVRNVLIAVALLAGALWIWGRARAGHGSTVEVEEGERVKVISRGEEVDIASHLDETGLTVVEFTADW